MMRITETVKQLLIINVILFIGASTIAPMANEWLALYFPLNDSFFPWQIFTHMFMHGGLMHIFFNMFGIFMFGSALEHFWGGKKFLFFYISCGLGAALLHLGVEYYDFQTALAGASDLNLTPEEIRKIINLDFADDTMYRSNLFEPQVVDILRESGKLGLLNVDNFKALFDASVIANTRAVGASGALYGVLVAFAFMFPNAELMLIFFPIPIKAKYFVPGLVAIDLYMGLVGTSIFGGGGIAHFAHVGGALTGFLMMWYWKKKQFNKNRWN